MSTLLSVLFALLVQSTPTVQESPRSLLLRTFQTNIGSVPVNDLIAIGDQINERGERQPLKIYAQGSKSIRIEQGNGEKQQILAVSNGAGWTGEGTATKNLPEHVATQRVSLFPFLDLLSEVNNPELQVLLKDTVMVGNTIAGHLQVRLLDAHPERRFLRRGLDEQVDYYIDAQTFLVLRSERFISTIQNMDLKIPHIEEFSDYRQVNGVQVPFRIKTTEGTPATSVHSWTTILQSVQINSGVPTNIFDRGGEK